VSMKTKKGSEIISHMIPDEPFVLPEFTDRSHTIAYKLPYRYLKVDVNPEVFDPAPVIDWWNGMRKCINDCES